MTEITPQKLIRLRTAKGYSQQEVADRVGVSQRTYSMWERGENKPKYSSVMKLLEVLEFSDMARTDGGGIPLIKPEAIGRFGNTGFSIKPEDVQAIFIIPDFKGVDFMMRVQGSGMQPKYSSGDIVACRTIKGSRFIQWNKTYLIATKEQGILCKRLRKSSKEKCYLAVSDNIEYEPFDIPLKEITAIALIVGIIRLE